MSFISLYVIAFGLQPASGGQVIGHRIAGQWGVVLTHTRMNQVWAGGHWCRVRAVGAAGVGLVEDLGAGPITLDPEPFIY